MPGKREDRVGQRARGGRDVNVAGRDQAVIIARGHAVVSVASAGEAGLPVPGLLPRDVGGFTGREDELARLGGLAGGRVVVSAIGGTAGVGKTALAIHVAHQLLPRFPDGHLYADLRGYSQDQEPAEPGEVLQVFLRLLGVPAEEVPATVEERAGQLRQILAERRVLMVLDNARTEAQVRPLLPGAGGSLVLVTSRSVLAGLEVDERISLDILPEGEAATMLAQLVGEARAEAEQQAVTEVARLCGRLPLALRIAGQLLVVHPHWSVERLAQMLADELDRLARLGAGDLTVRAAFEVSYAQLAEEDARLFRLLGLHPGSDLTVAAAAALAGTPAEVTGALLTRLAEVNLVTEGPSERSGMHDLLRLFARSTCREVDRRADCDAAEARLVRHYVEVAEYLDCCVFPATPTAKQAGKLLFTPRQALVMFEAERLNFMAALGLAERRSWNEQVSRFGKSVSGVLVFLGYLDDMLTAEEAALAAARRVGDAPAEGQALNDLGAAYELLERPEVAITCYLESLAIRKILGDRRGEGQGLINLGSLQRIQENFDEATASIQSALEIFQEVGHKDGVAVALKELGDIYRGLRQFEEATDCYRQSVAICREIGDPHGESEALNNLGCAYRELQRFEEAIDCYRRDIAICQEIGHRRGEGAPQYNLGGVYQHLQRFEEAIGCYRQAIEICREIGDRYHEGQALAKLGNAYRDMRQRDRAATCWREAAAAMRDVADHEEAGRLEQLAAGGRTRRRRR
jgi:tetratricopeptide (TPR) repeat protein